VAVFLVFDWFGVKVVLVRAGTTSVESTTSTILDLARSRDGKAGGRGGSNITLQLSGGRGENAATSVRVGDCSVANAVGSRRVAPTNAVLAVTELADGTRKDLRC